MNHTQRITTPCPACGARSLFIGEGGHLTCSRIPNRENVGGCPRPSVEDAVERMQADLTAARGEIARLREALQSVQHNRDCSCYDARHGLPLGPCPRCVVGYDEVDAALAAKGGA